MKLFKGLDLFKSAYNATKHQIWVSVKLLTAVTLCFAVLMWLAEKNANSDYNFWDALVWTFVKYIEDPAEIASAPVTLFGKIVGTLVGVLGIAIFAVPAGLIGSGLMDAMEEERREKEGLACNIFALRPSTQLIIFDNKKLLYAYRMASIISETLDAGKGITADDVKDLQSTRFGFAENK